MIYFYVLYLCVFSTHNQSARLLQTHEVFPRRHIYGVVRAAASAAMFFFLIIICIPLVQRAIHRPPAPYSMTPEYKGGRTPYRDNLRAPLFLPRLPPLSTASIPSRHLPSYRLSSSIFVGLFTLFSGY